MNLHEGLATTAMSGDMAGNVTTLSNDGKGRNRKRNTAYAY